MPGLQLCVGIGSRCMDISQLSVSYQRAKAAAHIAMTQKKQSWHTSFSSFYGTLYKTAQILFRKRIRYQHKIRVVIKKASIVSDILQIYLYSIRQLFSLHCVQFDQLGTSS